MSLIDGRPYKHDWETIVKKTYGLPSAKRPRQIPKTERVLFVFEIKRIIYEMLSFSDSDKKRINAGFERLLNLSILEGLQREIVDHLGFAFALSAIGDTNKPIAMARYLPDFFHHLVGPKLVSFRKSDERDIHEALESLEFCHDLCVEENRKYSILSAIKSSVSEFMRIAILYRRGVLFAQARKLLNNLEKSSSETIGKKQLPRLHSEIAALRDEMRKELREAKLNWRV